jgi:TRAP-type mannitol/chloroaromatic compound transport system substrate-binding protein
MMAHNPGSLHSNSPMNSLADLDGLRIRTPTPAVSAVLQHYGGEPVGLPPGEQYENLQRGTIDGVAIDWYGIGAYHLTEVLQYHYEIPLYTIAFFFAMNQNTYDTLPDNVRTCVDDLSGQPLAASFGPMWDRWGGVPYAEEEASGDDVIVTATPEDIAQAQADLAGVTETLLQQVRDAGVDNADEILEALREAIARYE